MQLIKQSIYTHRMRPAPLRNGMLALLLGLASSLVFAGTLYAQFEMQDSTTSADLRGIVNVGNGTAWASGTHGTVLRTEDGGYMWQGCTTPPGAEQLDFRGIQAFDDQTAIVMSSGKGDLSRVYKTTDGCQTWKLVFTNPDAEGFFDAIRKMSRSDVFVLGDPVQGAFAIWHSSDSGTKWSRSNALGLSASPGQQGAFAASNSSLIASGLAHTFFGSGGKAGAFVYTRAVSISISGLTTKTPTQSTQERWTRTSVPIGSPGSDAAGIFSIAEDAQSNTLVAVGGDYTRPLSAERTSAYLVSGQQDWREANTPPHGYRSSVAYDAKTKTWITVGPNGTDISTDDGRNWRPLTPGKLDDPNADKQWNALSLPYVVGPHGRIGRLRDDTLTGPKNPR